MQDIEKVKRLRLGIIFKFESSWMGGIVYIMNLIKTLGFLDDEEKPEIYLFYKPDLSIYTEEIEYPYLTLIEWEFPSITRGHITSWLLRRNVFIEPILKEFQLDTVFPLQDYPVAINTRAKLVSWIADFQYKHYPEFFSRKQILGRTKRVKLALKHTDHLVVSSHDAEKDLRRFYRIRNDMKIHIYHFVSIIDSMEHVDMADLKVRYELPDCFYLVSNQFHRHKNHKVLFLALAELKDEGHKVHLAITGRFPKDENSPYLAELHEIIEKNNLHEQISLLGVIPRLDQLQIMRHARAVIQPSLFEGWSTVIEDAKSQQVPVIASSLNVNIEQLGEAGSYFDPHSPEELVSVLKDYPGRNMKDLHYEDYVGRVKEAARVLMGIFQ